MVESSETQRGAFDSLTRLLTASAGPFVTHSTDGHQGGACQDCGDADYLPPAESVFVEQYRQGDGDNRVERTRDRDLSDRTSLQSGNQRSYPCATDHPSDQTGESKRTRQHWGIRIALVATSINTEATSR